MYTILWSTQGGRAKACARRTARILRDATEEDDSPNNGDDTVVGTGYYGSSFDDYGSHDFLKLGEKKVVGNNSEGGGGGNGGTNLVILFVSTTGDAEHCDSIRDTWKILLQKSLPPNQFQNLTFALFCLGDRAYGPNAFCAAGRKLAARLVQLGAKPYCQVGYGDDGTPNGGVFRDLDLWLEDGFLGRFLGQGGLRARARNGSKVVRMPQSPYQVGLMGRQGTSSLSATKKKDSNSGERQEWQNNRTEMPTTHSLNLYVLPLPIGIVPTTVLD